MKVAAIVGPTAVGKTDVSLRVAERLDAEIVSVDSMQIYRGMDVGTAKPDRAARERVPHHLIDVRDAGHDLTVAEFQELGRGAIEDITSRGRLPLLVGGSGLYFRALVDDLAFPPRSDEVRRTLEAEAEETGAAPLYARLRALDPVAAERMEPNNVRRIVRALEVIEITGARFSDNVTWDRYESRYELAVAGLDREREELHRRIEERAAGMLDAGLVDEAEAVRAQGAGRTASQALGYRQVFERDEASARRGSKNDEASARRCSKNDEASPRRCSKNDEASPRRCSENDDLQEPIARATKRFARRQLAWFKADPRVEWFDAAAPDLDERLVAFFRGALALPL